MTARRAVPVILLALGLALDLLVIRAQVELAIGVATCLERAKFELILCVAMPPDWQIVVTAALAVALAFLLGFATALMAGSRAPRSG